ncbi:MAG: OmpA family protein [Alphaproteobacteria bacterium]
MIPDRDQSLSWRQGRNRGLKGVPVAVLAAIVTLGILGGCSTVPDWADPVDWFAEDAAPTKVGLAEGQARSQPTGFPNLASVPDQPPKIVSFEDRAVVQAGLTADRANAVYSGEKLTGAAPIQARATQIGTVRTMSDAPPVPKISNELTAGLRIPPAPGQTQVARTQVTQVAVVQAPIAQAPVVQAPVFQAPVVQVPVVQVPVVQVPIVQAPVAPTQVAQASAAGMQLRFPQFQNLQPGLAMPNAAGAQLVAVIYFGHSSSRLDGKDRAVLRDVIALHRQSGGTIRVVGHASAQSAVTDQVSHDLNNFEISLKRANSVAAELIALGAVRDQVRSEARSDRQPVFHEFMSTGQAGNRRVEIFLEN